VGQSDPLTSEAQLLRHDVTQLSTTVQQLATSNREVARTVHQLAISNKRVERTTNRGKRVVVGLVASLVLDIALTAGLLWSAERQADNIACQARYNETNNRRSRILTEVGAEERRAERAASDSLNAIFLEPSLQRPSAERTVEENQRLIQLVIAHREAAVVLQRERAEADRARAANPLPPPPMAVCN
jgi:hypothetical protein